MGAEANKFKLGVFVCCAAALAIAAVLILGAGRLFQKTERFITYFDETVQGLNEGSPVKFRGVPMGRVAKIAMAPREKLVAVEIEVFPHAFMGPQGDMVPIYARRKMIQEFVDQGLRVRLSMAGITGLKYLEFDQLDPEKYPVRPLSFKPPFKWVPSAPSTLKGLETNITVAVGRLARVDFEGIGDKVKSAVSRIDGLLANLDAKNMGTEVRDILTQAKLVAIDLRKITSSASGLIEKVDLDGGLAQTREIFADLKKLVKRVETRSGPLMDQIQKALAGLEKTSEKVGKLTANTNEQIAKADVPAATASLKRAFDRSAVAMDKLATLRDDARRTLRELDTALRSFRRFVDYMERNPNALISGKREPNK